MDVTSWESQLRKGAAELVVVAMLGRGRAYGLEILHAANAQGELIAEGGLYPLLNRLEKAGRIAAEWTLPETGGNPRKYYTLTPEGRATMHAMTSRWTAFRTTMTLLVEQRDE